MPGPATVFIFLSHLPLTANNLLIFIAISLVQA
jgi:hypothetical protein